MDLSLTRLRLIATQVERREAWLVGGLVLLAFVQCLELTKRQLSFDELFTFYIARLDSLEAILRAVPADGNPPLYYLLARLGLMLTSNIELAVRFPSILAFTGALLATWAFVRHRCGAIAALFALFVLSSAVMKFYAAEARPYAMLLAFTALALVGWQRAAERSSRRLLPLTLMMCAIAGAIASHHYGVLHIGIPLATGEATRSAQNRRFDWQLIGACTFGAFMLVVTAPLICQTNRILLDQVREMPGFVHKPGLDSFASYALMADPRLLVAFAALCILGFLIVRPPVPEAQRARIPLYEVSAAAALALLVPIMIGVAWLATGYYQARYAIGASIGIAILLGFAAATVGGRKRIGILAAICTMVMLGLLWTSTWSYRAISGTANAPEMLTGAKPDSILATAPAGEPVVVGSPNVYMRTWWYMPSSSRGKIHYLADLSAAVRHGNPLAELSLVTNQPFVPSKVERYEDFISTNRRFLLYCQGIDRQCEAGDDWIKHRLLAEGWSVKKIARQDDETLYEVERSKD